MTGELLSLLLRAETLVRNYTSYRATNAGRPMFITSSDEAQQVVLSRPMIPPPPFRLVRITPLHRLHLSSRSYRMYDERLVLMTGIRSSMCMFSMRFRRITIPCILLHLRTRTLRMITALALDRTKSTGAHCRVFTYSLALRSKSLVAPATILFSTAPTAVII